jgi:hypothetical protein
MKFLNGFTELIPDVTNTNVTFPDCVLARGFRIATNIMACNGKVKLSL